LPRGSWDAASDEDMSDTANRTNPDVHPLQAAIGVSLALLIVATWLVLHVGCVFFWPWTGATAWLAPLAIALQTWLYVGLFIIAHDCMHGSLAPGQPAVNRWLGRVALALYAAFDYDEVIVKHFAHHRHPGTADDPDFDDHRPQSFWAWYAKFFAEYFGWRQAIAIGALVLLYQAVLGVSLANILVFWALPALLSSLQLFTFGTYLPHRIALPPFADGHRARTNDYPAWLSLITCYHFGYHHEHHLRPGVPWWRLPAARRARDASTAPRASAVP